MRLLLGCASIGDYNMLGSILRLREFNDKRGITYIGASGTSILATLLAMNTDLNAIFYLYELLEKYTIDFSWDRKNIKRIIDGTISFDELSLRKTLSIYINDATFNDVYGRYGNNLEVVCYNLNRGAIMTFNRNDNPDMKIIDAIILSISLPGKSAISKYRNEIYLDATVASRYPNRYIKYDLGIYLSKKYRSYVDAIFNVANEQYDITIKDVGIREVTGNDPIEKIFDADQVMRTYNMKKACDN
jgi:NTE family protein